MAIKEFFEIPTRYRILSFVLMGVGILAIIVGYIVFGTGDAREATRFWASLLYNSVYFLLVTNATMFFICATTLAWGSWQIAIRRVSEAISAVVIPLGVITWIILMTIVFGGEKMSHLYHWTNKEAVSADTALLKKSLFLNIPFYLIWTTLTILLWIVLGRKMRLLSRSIDDKPLDLAAAKKYIWDNTVWAALFIVWFALTVMSTIPWLWLMSIDAHWYSTMYSWYSFASTFVAGVALIAVFVVYFKNQGYLEYANEEHLHDVGKFMFAFSIFWAYLWFSQYMLIWYANISEETIYFKSRIKSGPYSGIFWFMFIINFLVPFLILMRRGSKRNYTTVTFMAVVILFGHWLDFYQMVYASVLKEHVELGWLEFGVATGFIGLIMYRVAYVASKYPIIPRNHPFLKESIIHHT